MLDIKSEIQAILFLSEGAVPLEEFAIFYNKEQSEIREIVRELSEEIKDSGINLIIKNGAVSLKTNPLCGEAINKFFNPTIKVKKLSKSSMETLTIIAIKGPITKGEIENIKGVSVDASIQALVEKKLIYSKERKKSIGNPKLYEVTENFYGYVGLDSKEDLLNLDKAQWLNSLNVVEREVEDEN